MRKKIGTLLLIGSLGALCAGLCSCSSETVIDEYYNQGNVVQVTYDGSGGQIMGSTEVTIVDMFNPEKFTADAEGYVRIKLREPTDPVRPHPGTEPIKVLRQGYSLVGWYKTREVVKDEEGVVRDDNGKELVYDASVDKYYAESLNSKGETIREEAVPQYRFADPWDFKTSTVNYKVGDEGLKMTLYAAWQKPFTFEYFYQEGGAWKSYATTNFDYQIARTEEGKEDDDETKLLRDRVYVPAWSLGEDGSGKMENMYSSAYTFPVVKNMTFKAAYSDEGKQNPITRENPLKHAGTIDYETATFLDRVQKVYVEFDKGNYYRVSTAAQFSAIADETGFYTILADELDFKCSLTEGELKFPTGGSAIRWSNKFVNSEFTGSIEGENGKAVTFKNVGASYNGSNQNVGLFGSIAKSAVIRNVSFENAIFEIRKATSRVAAKIGMLAGTIEEGATLENVTVSGNLRLWSIETTGKLSVNLTANDNRTGVTAGDITITACGQKLTGSQAGKYEFTVDFHDGKTTVDEDGNVTLTIFPQSNEVNNKFEEQYHDINFGGVTV